jgi:hypothetical protein
MSDFLPRVLYRRSTAKEYIILTTLLMNSIVAATTALLAMLSNPRPSTLEMKKKKSKDTLACQGHVGRCSAMNCSYYCLDSFQSINFAEILGNPISSKLFRDHSDLSLTPTRLSSTSALA